MWHILIGSITITLQGDGITFHRLSHVFSWFQYGIRRLIPGNVEHLLIFII